MNFLKKVRRKVLILGSMMIFSGSILLGLGILLLFLPDMPPVALSTLSEKEVSSENFVSLNNFVPIDGYVTESVYNTDYYYLLIATKDKDDRIYYLTLKLEASLSDQLVRYYNDLPQNTWVTKKPYYGNLVTLQKDAKEFLDGYLAEYPITNGTILDLVIEGEPGIYQPDNTENQIIGAIFALFGLGILSYIGFVLFVNWNKDVMENAKVLSQDGDAIGYLERFDLSAQRVSDAYVNDEAILSNLNFKVKFIPFKDVLWAYQLMLPASIAGNVEILKTKPYIRFYKSTIIILRTVDKKRYMFALKSVEQAVDLIQRIKRQNPNLSTIAFEPSLEKAFKKDPLGFKAKADYILERLNKPQE